LRDFEYLEPSSIDQAIWLLRQYKDRARIIAGGTDLLVDMTQDRARPEYLVDLRNIPGLDGIDHDPVQGLRIGALIRISALARSTALDHDYAIIRQAAAVFGNIAITNMATLGGNLCNGVPSADMVPGLIALSATVAIAGPGGERTLPLEGFFVDTRRTVLGADEILTELRVPVPAPGTRGVYLKYAVRDKCDLPLVGVATVMTLDPTDGVCRDIKIALGNAAPTPIRARGAEAEMRDRVIDQAAIDRCAQAAAAETHPRSGSFRASPEYKKAMVRVFMKRAIQEAMASGAERGAVTPSLA
jgi:carbon-monoxide dehydrogenase medium subunit